MLDPESLRKDLRQPNHRPLLERSRRCSRTAVVSRPFLCLFQRFSPRLICCPVILGSQCFQCSKIIHRQVLLIGRTRVLGLLLGNARRVRTPFPLRETLVNGLHSLGGWVGLSLSSCSQPLSLETSLCLFV